jgi:hypothetical protein
MTIKEKDLLIVTDSGGPGEFKYDGGPKPYISKKTGEATPTSEKRVEESPAGEVSSGSQESEAPPVVELVPITQEQFNKASSDIDKELAKAEREIGITSVSEPGGFKESFLNALDFLGLMPSNKNKMSKSRRNFLKGSMAIVTAASVNSMLPGGKSILEGLSETTGIAAADLAAPTVAAKTKAFSAAADHLVKTWMSHFKMKDGTDPYGEWYEDQFKEIIDQVSSPEDLQSLIKEVANSYKEGLSVSATEGSAEIPTFINEFFKNKDSLGNILKLSGASEEEILATLPTDQELSNVIATWKNNIMDPYYADMNSVTIKNKKVFNKETGKIDKVESNTLEELEEILPPPDIKLEKFGELETEAEEAETFEETEAAEGGSEAFTALRSLAGKKLKEYLDEPDTEEENEAETKSKL